MSLSVYISSHSFLPLQAETITVPVPREIVASSSPLFTPGHARQAANSKAGAERIPVNISNYCEETNGSSEQRKIRLGFCPPLESSDREHLIYLRKVASFNARRVSQVLVKARTRPGLQLLLRYQHNWVYRSRKAVCCKQDLRISKGSNTGSGCRGKIRIAVPPYHPLTLQPPPPDQRKLPPRAMMFRSSLSYSSLRSQDIYRRDTGSN
ncbi:hypothetical protein RRG08_032622 [Elysia crispata]|uniref:Uncharacterized protein n=1 Tax=Elysia crispata TaxID=231223 RepID=A0AAE0Y141_9GAST|nr:hypothetical protein RRG08_032622 [Elysia crispata]